MVINADVAALCSANGEERQMNNKQSERTVVVVIVVAPSVFRHSFVHAPVYVHTHAAGDG